MNIMSSSRHVNSKSESTSMLDPIRQESSCSAGPENLSKPQPPQHSNCNNSAEIRSYSYKFFARASFSSQCALPLPTLNIIIATLILSFTLAAGRHPRGLLQHRQAKVNQRSPRDQHPLPLRDDPGCPSNHFGQKNF